MIDKDILDGLSELDEVDLKRIKLVDNKLKIKSDKKVSYRTKSIKWKESCNSCLHGPYWYVEWTEEGKENQVFR